MLVVVLLLVVSVSFISDTIISSSMIVIINMIVIRSAKGDCSATYYKTLRCVTTGLIVCVLVRVALYTT